MSHLRGTLLAFVLAIGFSPAGAGLSAQTAATYEVEVVANVAYKSGADVDPARHKLDLYLPRGEKNFPVLLFVHGGAWTSGDKALYGKLGEMYARNGVGTIIINYRLSPKVVHPAHVQDVASAFAWTHANIARYGGDPKNIFLCGHSAGGHLIALLSTNERYLQAEKLHLADIKGCMPISGVYTIVPGPIFKKAFTDDAEIVRSGSPFEHVKVNHPPFLIQYADKDYLTLDVQAEQFCKKLKDCKCEATSFKIADRSHISIVTRMVDQTDPVNQHIFEFMARHGGLKLPGKKETPR